MFIVCSSETAGDVDNGDIIGLVLRLRSRNVCGDESWETADSCHHAGSRSRSNLAGLTGDNQLYTTGRIRESVEGFYVTD
jgi:hypothetical protein